MANKTIENLVNAYGMESRASTRYLLFEKIAKEEGYEDIAKLFKETAEGERAHAVTHLAFLKDFKDPVTNLEIGNTEKNLIASIHAESHEFTDLYPGLVKTAREEGLHDIADWFETLAKAERSHAGKFEDALERLRSP